MNDIQAQIIAFIIAFDECNNERQIQEIQHFKFALMLCPDIDVGYIYTTAIFHYKYTLSQIIKEYFEYDTNNQYIKSEIFFYADWGRFDCIGKFLDDGYFPQFDDINEVKSYFQEKGYNEVARDVFRRLIQIFRARALNRIINQLKVGL